MDRHLFVIQVDNRAGYIDAQGEVVLRPTFLAARRFAEGLGLVHVSEHVGWRFIEPSGAMALTHAFLKANPFRDGFALVQLKGGEFAYLSRDGREVPCPVSLHPQDAPEGMAVIQAPRGGWGFQDLRRNVTIPHRFDAATPFQEGLAAVQVKGRWGYINRDGQTIIEPRFQAAGPFSGGLAPVREAGRWGFVDCVGEPVIPCGYDDVGNFGDGLAPVCMAGAWSYVDGQGNPGLRGPFEHAHGFRDARARVCRQGRWGFIRRDGAVAVPLVLDAAEDFDHGLALVRSKGAACYMDVAGRVVWTDR